MELMCSVKKLHSINQDFNLAFKHIINLVVLHCTYAKISDDKKHAKHKAIFDFTQPNGHSAVLKIE